MDPALRSPANPDGFSWAAEQIDRDSLTARLSHEFGVQMPSIGDRLALDHKSFIKFPNGKVCIQFFEYYFSTLGQLFVVIDKDEFLANNRDQLISPDRNDKLFYCQKAAIIAIASPLYPVPAPSVKTYLSYAKDMAFTAWIQMHFKTVDDFPADVLRYLQTRILVYLARVNVGCSLPSLYCESQKVVTNAAKIARSNQKMDEMLKWKLVIIVACLHLQIALLTNTPPGDEWRYLRSCLGSRGVAAPGCFVLSYGHGYPSITTNGKYQFVIKNYLLSNLQTQLDEQWMKWCPLNRFRSIMEIMHLNRNKRNDLYQRFCFQYGGRLDMSNNDDNEIAAKIYDEKVICYEQIRTCSGLFSDPTMTRYRGLFNAMFRYDLIEARAFLDLIDLKSCNGIDKLPELEKRPGTVAPGGSDVIFEKEKDR
ncbi:uncharacterized protein EAE97_006091 [Botrytis byssoidea]|uniref:Transcription factor domain-containing protein n=1 Tax=Botrytis byssoidea TaxID=139641 RepID=A0A9P5LUD8_9HELO|nr:uncharacterized protein EAE97_006091 [Botrytis byssoidea]KAF7942637.1 hypothetical protein EAE97_006091 [Botrytis byssoidea]